VPNIGSARQFGRRAAPHHAAARARVNPMIERLARELHAIAEGRPPKRWKTPPADVVPTLGFCS